MSRLTVYQPKFANLFSEFDQFFNAALGNQEYDSEQCSNEVTRTAHSTYDQDEKHFYVYAEVPGVKKEDLSLKIEDGILTIEGKRNQTRAGQTNSLLYTKRLSLPEGVDEEKLSATLENGVVKITLAKSETKRPRSISID